MRHVYAISTAIILLTAGCAGSPDHAHDWSNISYAYINCPPGSDDVAGCGESGRAIGLNGGLGRGGQSK